MTTSSAQSEEGSMSPFFTPRGRERSLPLTDEETSPSSSLRKTSGADTYRPLTHALELGEPSTSSTSAQPVTPNESSWKTCRSSPQDRFQDSLPYVSDSPPFHYSPVQHHRPYAQNTGSLHFSSDHSTRLSCSTLASSNTRTNSESSTVASPSGFGFAYGSPAKDKLTNGSESPLLKHANANSIGLGLLSKDYPSSTGHSLDGHGGLSLVGGMPIAVPPRRASRSRANSTASSKHSSSPTSERRVLPKSSHTSTLSRNVSYDDVPLRLRPEVPRSMSSSSISSSVPESMQSHSQSQMSPRTSSLRRAKTRPRLKTKASEPILNARIPISSPQVSHLPTRSVSHGETAHLDAAIDLDSDEVEEKVRANSASRSLIDYLAYTACDFTDESIQEIEGEGDEDVGSTSMAVALAEEGTGVFLTAEGKTLAEVERQAGPATTHLLLSGCKEPGMDDFLDRVLPIVGGSLLVLDVSQTCLSRLPDSLVHCTSLEELNISSNVVRPSVQGGGQWGSSLQALRILLADSCSLVVLPVEMAHLTNLRTLSLQDNRLSHLPTWLHRLTHLETLLLTGNQFEGAWQKVCAAFTSSACGLDKSLPAPPSSAPPHFATSLFGLQDESPYEELEEMAEEDVPATAPLPNEFKGPKGIPLRPFVKRMLSNGSELASLKSTASSLSSLSLRDDDSPGGLDSRASSRRPSFSGRGGGEMGEKKWGTLMRKLGRKVSTSQMSSESSSPTRSRSNSISAARRAGAMPDFPSSWQEQMDEHTIRAKKRSNKRTSFLALSQDTFDAGQRRLLGGLMQYLHDMDDLRSSPRSAVLGSVLSLDLSMASQYSSPSKAPRKAHPRQSTTSQEEEKEEEKEPLAMPDKGKIKDDAQRRICILQELISTEVSYIRGLQELVDIYVQPCSVVEPSSGQALVPAPERRRVFGNVEAILQFHHGALLPALQIAAQALLELNTEQREGLREADAEAFHALSATLAEAVGGVMVKHAAFFRMYPSYVNGVDAAQARVSQWRSAQKGVGETTAAMVSSTDASEAPAMSTKERKKVKAFLARARADPRHSQLSLETYLHLPVQRIPRYRLLFEDLVRSCPPHRLQDPTILERALESICSVATLMNESKRQSEKNRKLLEWQGRIRDHLVSPLVQPHRQLIKDGTVLLKRVVVRVGAFHVIRDGWTESERQASLDHDGCVCESDSEGSIQVDCLDQQSMTKRVGLLLCSDILVVTTDEAPQLGQGSPVRLFAVLRIQQPVQLIGQTALRVVDARNIFYFSASSPAEASDWQQAMTSVCQKGRP